MNEKRVVLEFSMQEGTIAGGWYQIIIKDCLDNEVLNVKDSTMKGAYRQAAAKGYKLLPQGVKLGDMEV